jgi:hypothetical protein
MLLCHTYTCIILPIEKNDEQSQSQVSLLICRPKRSLVYTVTIFRGQLPYFTRKDHVFLSLCRFSHPQKYDVRLESTNPVSQLIPLHYYISESLSPPLTDRRSAAGSPPAVPPPSSLPFLHPPCLRRLLKLSLFLYDPAESVSLNSTGQTAETHSMRNSARSATAHRF